MIIIRRFLRKDVEAIQSLIIENLSTVNKLDTDPKKITNTINSFTIERIIQQSKRSHMYVAEDVNTHELVGTASIAPFWNSLTESIILTVFTKVNNHKQGIGRQLFEAIYQDDFFIRSHRIEIPSSLYAVGFYKKMGFSYKNGVRNIDSDGNIRLELIK